MARDSFRNYLDRINVTMGVMEIQPEYVNRATSRVLDSARSLAGLTQQQLADRSGLSIVTVQKILSGEQATKIPQFMALAKGADADPGALLDQIETVAKRMSAVAVTSNDIDTKRKQNEARTMTVEQIEALPHAATRDPEMDSPEPD